MMQYEMNASHDVRQKVRCSNMIGRPSKGWCGNRGEWNQCRITSLYYSQGSCSYIMRLHWLVLKRAAQFCLKPSCIWFPLLCVCCNFLKHRKWFFPRGESQESHMTDAHVHASTCTCTCMYMQYYACIQLTCMHCCIKHVVCLIKKEIFPLSTLISRRAPTCIMP